MSVIVQKPLWSELLWVVPVFWILVYGVKVCNDDSVLWNSVATQFNCLAGVVHNTQRNCEVECTQKLYVILTLCYQLHPGKVQEKYYRQN